VVVVGSDELYEEEFFSYVYSSESGRPVERADPHRLLA
jgi:hypothetical protein